MSVTNRNEHSPVISPSSYIAGKANATRTRTTTTTTNNKKQQKLKEQQQNQQRYQINQQQQQEKKTTSKQQQKETTEIKTATAITNKQITTTAQQ